MEDIHLKSPLLTTIISSIYRKLVTVVVLFFPKKITKQVWGVLEIGKKRICNSCYKSYFNNF